MSKRNDRNQPVLNPSIPGTRYTKGGIRPDDNGPDVGIVGLNTEATFNAAMASEAADPDADVVDGEETNHTRHAVPGADKQHHKAHAMNKGETKHTGV